MSDLTISLLVILIGAAVVDSINPCAFGVLFFILGYLAKVSKSRTKILLDGLAYTAGVFTTYFILGLLIFFALQGVETALGGESSAETIQETIQSTGIPTYFYQAIGAIIMIAGVLEIKDYFAYGKGITLSILPRYGNLIKKQTDRLAKISHKSKFYGIIFSFIMGILVALVELPCTGFVYLGILAILASTTTGLTAGTLTALTIYNIIFVLPLLIITIIVFKGTKIKKLQKWKNDHKKLMRLVTGIALLLLGFLIFFFSQIQPLLSQWLGVVI